jgi:YD repeat-containing protein
MQDDVGHQWTWAFDSLGRNYSKSDPDAGTWSFAYDDAGRLTGQTDAKGQTTTFGYDTAGRLATKSNAAGTVAMTYSEARSSFFNQGRVTTVTAPGTTLQTDYDALGRAVRMTRNLDGTNYTVERRYDSGGFLRGITYPDGDEVGSIASPLVYDAVGRLTAIPGIVNSVTYDALGRPTQQENANNTVTTRNYSAERGFLTRIQTNGPADLGNPLVRNGVIQDLVYNNDAAGLVLAVTAPFQNEAWSYGYDDLYRLTQATSLMDSAQNQSFSYDSIGRITYNSRVGSYSYPAVGQPRPHGPSAVNGQPLSYDNNGNLISGNGRTPTWSADNTITQVTKDGCTTSFLYDGFGERLKKTGAAGTSLYPFGDDYEITNGQVTKYVSVEGLAAC